MLEIIIKGHSGHGKSTLASRIAKLLYDDGFEVAVGESEENNVDFATPERLSSIRRLRNITINTEQLMRTDTSSNAS
jgi:tRNA uridine 5-carbamoylmethylation protein Kti12